MKKLFVALCFILSPSISSAAGDAVGYVCDDWTPNHICDDNGEVLDSWRAHAASMGYADMKAILSVGKTPGMVIKKLDITFYNNYNMALQSQCTQECPAVVDCPEGEAPGIDQVCAPHGDGPYECPDNYLIGHMCDPETGTIKPRYVDEKATQGHVYTGTFSYNKVIEDLGVTPASTKMERWQVFQFVNTASNEAWSVTCMKVCPSVNSCKPEWTEDEYGVCQPPPVVDDSSITIPSNLLASDTPQAGAITAAEQARLEGDPTKQYAAVIYHHPGIGYTGPHYRHSDLIEEQNGSIQKADVDAVIVWLQNAGFDLLGVVAVYPEGSGITAPTQEDLDRAKVLRDEYGFSYHWIHTSTLISYQPATICNKYRPCNPPVVEPDPTQEPPPADDPVNTDVYCNPYREAAGNC